MADSPEDAWCRGQLAIRSSLPLNANPYPAGTGLALDWKDGWREEERLQFRQRTELVFGLRTRRPKLSGPSQRPAQDR